MEHAPRKILNLTSGAVDSTLKMFHTPRPSLRNEIGNPEGQSIVYKPSSDAVAAAQRSVEARDPNELEDLNGLVAMEEEPKDANTLQATKVRESTEEDAAIRLSESHKLGHSLSEISSLQKRLTCQEMVAGILQLDYENLLCLRNEDLLSWQQLQVSLHNQIRELKNDLHEKDEKLRRCREQHQMLRVENTDLKEKSAALKKLVNELELQLADDSTNSGSYDERSATPALLNQSVQSFKSSVAKFSKLLVINLKKKCDIVNLVSSPMVYPAVYCARASHVNMAMRALICDFLFHGFDNETYMMGDGAPLDVDPSVRTETYFHYFKQLSRNVIPGTVDQEFEHFYSVKISEIFQFLHNVIFEINDKTSLCENALDLWELGGEELYISFREAARKVWALHKLCFSFEPPAMILRAKRLSDINLKFMEPIVNLEDDERFISKVGFMIVPGVRVRKTVIRCEVYLAAMPQECRPEE